jgi:phosphopantothenoylcysteine decarboxylase/phosphopantothenate--cysteine ligase
LADDLLTVTALAARCSIIIAPAMDGGMYEHPATQANLQTLQERGVTLIEPEVGRFASGMVGQGRFPDTPILIGHLRRVLGRNGPLAGRKVVVTAGGTREPLDPVRYITNHSSGKQGHALAQAALDAGADVVLISAARNLPAPVGAAFVAVNSAEEMCEAVLAHVDGADALVKAAAVADFRPTQVTDQKIKKTDTPGGAPTLQLTRTPDILLEVKHQREKSGWPRVVVGFAAETQNLLDNAQDKLARKGLDLIVANDITAPDAGFAADTNRVVLLDAAGNQRPLDLASKAAIGEAVIARVVTLLDEKKP